MFEMFSLAEQQEHTAANLRAMFFNEIKFSFQLLLAMHLATFTILKTTTWNLPRA